MNKLHKFILLFAISFVFFFTGNAAVEQNPSQNTIVYQNKVYPLYSQTLEQSPAQDFPSPLKTGEGKEVLLAVTIDNQYTLIPVTVENGEPLLYSYKIPTLFGKDSQLGVDSGDFPTLAKTGLHSESELDLKEMITGMPLELITYIGRPGRFSYEGFMAADETIISVLKGDNRLVKALGLTHPQTARPLFHVWNIILEEIRQEKFGRFTGISRFKYNGKQIYLKAEGTKGWQRSIFLDDIRGRFNISVRRDLSPEEKLFLQTKYSHLSSSQREEMEAKLSHIGFSEMVPYYIMRYGFYEGHTGYRADPIAIAFIFGLKNLEQIETAFPESLDKTLASHFR